MAEDTRTDAAIGRAALLRTGLALAAVFGLLQVASLSDLLSDVTRPLVVLLLRTAGIAAADLQGSLAVGQLVIPWTRDCAGLNILGTLWAVTLWTYRRHPFSRQSLLRLALAVPAAAAANVGRILTLIAYRAICFPAVESPQLHYFFGFLWLIPFLGLFTPGRTTHGQGPGTLSRLEVLHLAAVLALLAPFVPAAGGTVVAVSALVVLLQSRLHRESGHVHPGLAAAWLTAGLLVSAGRMESLWIPWLLCCPWFVSSRVIGSPGGIAVLLGTVPLVAMHPVGGTVALAGAAWQLLRLAGPARSSSTELQSRHAAAALPRWGLAALAGLAMFPFLASSAAAQMRTPVQPQAGVMSRQLDVSSYRVRLVGQSPDLSMDWYGPFGDGRHHTLPVCMRYRGVNLKETREPGVFTDGTFWMREFFLVNGTLVLDYPAYLRQTFSPFSAPGVHLIASAPEAGMSAGAFSSAAERLARDLHRSETDASRAASARQLR